MPNGQDTHLRQEMGSPSLGGQIVGAHFCQPHHLEPGLQDASPGLRLLTEGLWAVPALALPSYLCRASDLCQSGANHLPCIFALNLYNELIGNLPKRRHSVMEVTRLAEATQLVGTRSLEPKLSACSRPCGQLPEHNKDSPSVTGRLLSEACP